MKLDVRFGAARAVASLSAYHSKIRDRALVRALNRTATTVRAVAARLIAPEVKPLPIAEIKKAIAIERATRSKLVAVVRAGGRKRIPLTMLGARQTKTGVTVRVGGKVYTIAHAFINEVRGSRLGARVRAPDFKAQLLNAVKFRAKRLRRSGIDYPIAEVMAPGVPTVFVQAKIMQGMRRAAIERFNTVIAQEVKFLQSKGL